MSLASVLKPLAARLPWKRSRTAEGRVGIEIGSERLAIACFRGGVLQLVDSAQVAAASDITTQLQQWVQQYRLQGVACTAVVHPKQYQLILTERPPVDDEELAAALPWKIKDLLHHPVSEVAIDAFALPNDAFRGRQRMIYAVAMPKTQLTTFSELIEGVGLALDTVSIPDVLLWRMIEKKPANRAILRLDRANGILSVANDNVVYLCRSFDIGLDKIRSTLPVLDENSFSGGQFLDALALELQRSLDYYESQLGKGGVSELLVVPLPERDAPIIRVLAKQLGARVNVLDVNELVSSSVLLELDAQHDVFAAVAACLPMEVAPVANEAPAEAALL
jgi:MSHA biogenesis protein MshI